MAWKGVVAGVVDGVVVWRLVLPQEKVTRRHLEFDGMAVWRLHKIMSVRDVFGRICDDSKLELRGVHKIDHDRGWACARTTVC